MTTNPQPTPPAGYEILTPEVAKMKPEDMRYRYKDRVRRHDDWDAWDPNNAGWHINEEDFDFIAPIGTTALLLTPGPEAGECDCDQTTGYMGPPVNILGRHSDSCPSHPRNAYVKVLPGWLARLKEKPEGLLFASAIMEWKWTKDTEIWEKVLAKQLTRHYAYAVPRHVFDALTRPDPVHDEVAKMDESKLQGEQQYWLAKTLEDATRPSLEQVIEWIGETFHTVPKGNHPSWLRAFQDAMNWRSERTNPSPGAAVPDQQPHLADYVQQLHIITGPNGMCRCGEDGITCGERLRQVSHEIADCQLMHNLCPSRTPPPVDGSGPTAEEMLDWLENGGMFHQRSKDEWVVSNSTTPWGMASRGPTLRAAIAQAMQSK